MKDNETNLNRDSDEKIKQANLLSKETNHTMEEELDLENLTPWQKENLKYLQETGQEPKWLDKPESEEPIEQLSFEKKNLDELAEISAEQTASQEEKKLAQERTDKMDAEKKTYKENSENIANDDSKDNLLDLRQILKEAVADEQDMAYESEVLKKNSFANKLPKVKQQRQRRMLKRLLLLLSMFLIVLLITAYYVSPYSKVQTLEIVGNKVVTKQQIATATGIQKNEFFWNAYLSEPVEKNVKKALPRVQSVDKSIVNINSIKLKIKEYNDMAYAKFEGEFYPILENGKILDEAVTVQNKEFTIFTNFENDKQLERVLNIYMNMDKKIKENLDEVILNPSGKVRSRIVLRMKDGNQVIGSVKDLGEKIAYYPQIVKEMSEPGIIDMEAGIFSYSYESKEATEKLADLKQNEDESTEQENNQENQDESEDQEELIDELQNNP